MLQHHRLRGLAFAVLVVSVVLAGCAADHNARQQASASAAPATTRLGQRQLRHMLLTLAEVQAVRSAPAGLVEQPRSSLYEDPDPRLPCGRTPTYPLTISADAAMVAFSTGSGSDEVWVVNVVYGLSPGYAERHLAEVRADMRPGCQVFVSKTPFFSHQTNQFRGEVPLPPLGDDRVATSANIWPFGGDQAFGMTARIRSGNNLATVSVVAAAPISPVFFIGLATAAAKKLA